MKPSLEPQSASLPPPLGPVLKAKDYHQFSQGEAVLARAHEAARTIEARAGDAYQQARRRGFRTGLAQARRREAKRHFAACARAIDYLAQLEDRMIEMADEAIRAIAGQRQAQNLEWQLVRRALARYRTLPDLVLRVPAEKETQLREQIAELARKGGQHFPSMRIEGDAKLAAGNCLLESPLGKVNIGLANQLAVLRRALETSKSQPLQLEHHLQSPPSDEANA